MHRILIVVVLTCLTGAAAAQTDVYVSVTGTDPANCANSTICRTSASPCRTIQCAIDSTVGGETVRVSPGTYAECVSAYFVDAGSGAPVPSDITIVATDYETNFRSNTTILDSTGVDCTVDLGGGQILKLPVVELGDRSIFRGFTVKGNLGGGGVRGYGAVQITNNVIEGNSALRGGGVYVYTGYYVNDLDGEAIVRSNVVRNNLAAVGGGVMVRGTAFYGGGGSVTVESNTITTNTAEDAGGGYGGGLYVLTDSFDPTDVSRVTITKNVVEGNVAVLGTGGVAYGGGIYASTYGYPAAGSEVIDIVDNVVRQNFAEGYGGGVLAQILGTYGPAASNPGYEVKVEDNSITANGAGTGGGGVYVYVQNTDLDNTVKATLAIEGNAIAGNDSNGSVAPQYPVPAGGGGLYLELIQARNTTPNVDVRVKGNLFQTNTSNGVGGGASLYVLADSEPDVSSNVATDARVRFENNLLTGNAASTFGLAGEGGGVHALAESRGQANGSVALKFNTVADNVVDPGGAAVFVDATTFQDSLLNIGTASMEVSNSILFRNDELELESGFAPGTNGRSLSVRYNDVYDTAGTLYGPNVGDRTGQNGNQSFEPGLSTFYVPLLCSPVIDAGDPLEGTRDGSGRLTSEAQPNGGLVNLGHLGNSLNAQRTLPDASGDGIVDGVDLLRVASSFASTSSQAARYNPLADRDRDGDVDGDDLAYVAAFYGQACP